MTRQEFERLKIGDKIFFLKNNKSKDARVLFHFGHVIIIKFDDDHDEIAVRHTEMGRLGRRNY